MSFSSLSKASATRIRAFETSDISRTVRSVLLVGISYYVGTRIGFAWTPSGQPNSTFWPPNAVLLVCLIAGSAKNLVDVPSGSASGPHVGSTASRSARLNSAGLVHNQHQRGINRWRFIDTPKSLDSVRGVLVFVRTHLTWFAKRRERTITVIALSPPVPFHLFGK